MCLIVKGDRLGLIYIYIYIRRILQFIKSDPRLTHNNENNNTNIFTG